jgi:replicative DNA helicase
VLGSILHAGRIDRTFTVLKPEDFYRPAHAEIFATLLELDNRGMEVDPATLLRELVDVGSLARVGGAPYLHTLMADAFPASRSQHVASIRDAAHRRRLSAFGVRVQEVVQARGPGVTATTIIERLRGELDQLAASATVGKRSTVELGDLLHERIAAYDEPVPPGLSTGWPNVDFVLGGGVGMQPGRVYVIGARTGVGKTLVAINLAIAAAHAKERVALFTLEMNRDEVGDRIVAAVAGVSLKKLQSHDLDDRDRHNLGRMVDRFGGDPMTIDDSAMNTLASIRAACRDMTRAIPPLGLVVVDYLQLVDPADRKAPRHEQVSAISRGLKVMAKELRVPVVALAQLNREVEARPDKTPRLSDLRESGSLEQDADVVMLLHRKEDGEKLIVTIAKNRSGPAGVDCELDWSPSKARLTKHMDAA